MARCRTSTTVEAQELETRLDRQTTRFGRPDPPPDKKRLLGAACSLRCKTPRTRVCILTKNICPDGASGPYNFKKFFFQQKQQCRHVREGERVCFAFHRPFVGDFAEKGKDGRLPHLQSNEKLGSR